MGGTISYLNTDLDLVSPDELRNEKAPGIFHRCAAQRRRAPDAPSRSPSCTLRGGAGDAGRETAILYPSAVRSAMSDIHTAAGAGDLEKVIGLLHAGADVESGDGVGDTPLSVASAAGHAEVVKALIEHGANVNAAEESEFYTALMAASVNGHVEIVRLLLNHGAEVDAEDDYNATALTRAAEHGYADVVRLLLEHGADAGIREERDMTALELAESRGHQEIAAMLREYQ